MSYVPLNIKTHYSLLRSMIKIEDLINFAKSNNIKALSITDDNMYGVMEFYKMCLKNSIKPIIGLELKLENYIFILYAKNYNGYKNLMKLQTINSQNKIEEDCLKKYSNDLLCIVPFNSLNIYNKLSNIYHDIFKSYKNNLEKEKLNGNVIYMNEILYLEKNDYNYLKYLSAIKDKISIDEVNVNYDNYLICQDISDPNNSKINDMCNIEIPFSKNLLPKYQTPNNIDSYEYLKELCKNGLIRIFGKKVRKIYLDRLKYELEIIHKMGFDDYFLIVYDYVKFAKDNHIMVAPGRGSAAGSLVSYLLNITTIDPIKYNLFFERFLNPERIGMPDIDMDFDANRREEVIRYCINKYGIKKVAPIITFSTLKSRQVIKDVAKVSNIEGKIVEILCNMLDRNLSLIDNYHNPKIKKYLEINPELKKVYNASLKLENLKRQISIHAAGVVMGSTDLEEVIPLTYHTDMYITGYSMEYLEELGLLKMDFLGISFLTLISDIINDINKNGKQISFDDIRTDDNKVFEIFKSANTLGIFQFESSGMMNFIRKLKPNSFDDLVAAIALFRPGPMANIDSYIKRKENKEKVTYLDERLEPILNSTYGIIIYQEQIMQIASTLANYSLGEADVLRKAMSKKKEDILLKEKAKFINGCLNNGLKEDKALEIYELVLKFASYGFNKSHSVAYSLVAYKMAYLKLYYPEIFLKNLLTRFINSSDKTKDYIFECKKNKVNILKPSINLSGVTYEFMDKALRYPITNIKNVGNIVATEIINQRKNGLFKDIFDFVKRLYGKTVNRKVLESLILSGSFDEFEYNKKTLINNLDIIINYSELGDLLSNEALKPVLEVYDEYSSKELFEIEKNIFGFYLTNHPITKYKDDRYDLSKIDLYFDKVISPILYVDRVKEVITKKNEKMLFVSGTDEENILDVVLFPKVLINKEINVGDIIKFTGKIEKRFDQYQLIANNFNKLD